MKIVSDLPLLAASGIKLIQSIDVNPFICLPQGGKAVDAVIITRASGEQKEKH